jgi:hypothetical protein
LGEVIFILLISAIMLLIKKPTTFESILQFL